MSGWVWSARKFVVSSLVSFAEELENVVLVLTDAEQAHARDHSIQNFHQRPPLEYDGHVLGHTTTTTATTTTEPMVDVCSESHAYNSSSEVCTSDGHLLLIDSRPVALTTQPEASTPVQMSMASVTSLPVTVAISSSSSSSSSSSLNSYYALPLLKSCPNSRSLPDVSAASHQSQTVKVSVSVSSPSSSSLSSSKSISVPSSSSSHFKSLSSPYRLHSRPQASRNPHNSYVHRSRNGRHFQTRHTQTDCTNCSDDEFNDASKSSHLTHNMPQLTVRNSNSNNVNNTNINTCSDSSDGKSEQVVLGSKRHKKMAFVSLKRPGKVIRTSSNETQDQSPSQTSQTSQTAATVSVCQPSASTGTSTTVTIHVMDNSADGWGLQSQGQGQKEHHSLLHNPNSSHRSPSPEDLSIPNRGSIHDLSFSTRHNIQAVYNSNHDTINNNTNSQMEHIRRVSLLDKLTHIINSTLVTLSNMLRLEDEEIDLTAMCRNTRARSRSIQGQDAELVNDKNNTLPTGNNFSDQQGCISGEDSYVELVSDTNLTLSRINSLVSLESFEVLSKEDDNMSTAFWPPLECQNQLTDPSVNPNFENSSDHNLSNKHSEFSKMDKDNGDVSDNVQTTSSIEFIRFEVSDLITKRYFDSKTQRLTTSSVPSKDGQCEEFSLVDAEQRQNVQAMDVETESDIPEQADGRDYNMKEANESPCQEEDGDGSSASFDVISEDACHEPFNLL